MGWLGIWFAKQEKNVAKLLSDDFVDFISSKCSILAEMFGNIMIECIDKMTLNIRPVIAKGRLISFPVS